MGALASTTSFHKLKEEPPDPDPKIKYKDHPKEVLKQQLDWRTTAYLRMPKTTKWEEHQPFGAGNTWPDTKTRPIPLGKTMEFPTPSDIKINMMPFIMGDKMTLPTEVRQYWPLIEACNLSSTEKKKVGYLTITESWVAPGETQRVGGLHIDAPELAMPDATCSGPDCVDVSGDPMDGGSHGGMGNSPRTRAKNFRRGGVTTSWEIKIEGGMFIASTVGGSCEVWPVIIRKTPNIVGPLGDAEHFRPLLGCGYKLEAGELVWLTDRTPHESLPFNSSDKPQYRQFFHLTTSNLSYWYSQHNTSNPLGIKPTAKVLSSNKFDLLKEITSL